MARLRLFVKNADGERVYDFDRAEIVVGRDAAADVGIDDKKLSRRHCRFYEAVDGWRVADLESRNGTILNGTPVFDDRIREGDRVELGHVVCTVSFPRGVVEPTPVRSSVGRGAPEQLPLPVPRVRTEVEELRGEVRVLEHLVAVNAKMAELSDEDALLDAVLDAAVELLEARRGFLLLAADDHVVVLDRHASSMDAAALATVQLIGVAVTCAAFGSGKTLVAALSRSHRVKTRGSSN